MTEPAYELLYFGEDHKERDRVKALLTDHYGDRVRFETDYDYIHSYRLAVGIEGESEDGWCEFADQHDLTDISLVALSRRMYGEG